ncbi:MAG: hypothetical protein KBD24_02340 [Candidatus Pacebacteria bacterium]|nr:hypothetical protein [Candidatus Paceibacterota bacterium]
MLTKKIDTGLGLFLVAAVAIVLGYAVITYAHHNSPMYDFIEENENFDKMDMHEAAIDSIPDSSSMDRGATQGTYEDTSKQAGSTDGPTGATNQTRSR